MSLIGIAPADRSTPVGKVRSLVGDTSYEPTVDTGYGTYQYFSDDDLTLFLEVEGDSIAGATAQAYEGVAAALILEAKNITTNDLRVATEKRAGLMLTLAGVKRRQAVAEGIEAMNDVFDVVPFAGWDRY